MKIMTHRIILTLLMSTSLFVPTLTHACSCRGATDLESRFIRAQEIVIAEVINTRLIKTVHKEHDLEYIVADIKVIENFKRTDNTPLTKVIDLVPDIGNCSIALISGMEYVFFVDDHHYEDEEDEMGWIKQDNYVGRCTGSHRINPYSITFDDEHAQLKKLAKLNQQGKLTPQTAQNDCDTILPESFRLND